MPEFHIEVPDPEDVQAQIKHAMDRHQMHVQNMQHEVQRLFKELTEDQLVTLRFLFNSCATVGPLAASYYEGLASASLTHRFSWCFCGEKHDDVSGLIEQSQEPAPPLAIADRFVESQHQVAESAPPPLEATDSPLPTGINPSFDSFDDLVRQMEEFTVEPAPDSTTGVMQCTGCGQMYPSLEDRMLRRDCPGCIEQAKWG